MVFDSHCHLTAEAFDPDRADVLARAREAGVEGLVTIASEPDDARAALDLARAHPWIWSTAGVHPHEADSVGADALDRVRDLLADPRVVAVGECGLDFYYDNAPRAAQTRVFDAQVELASETGLPLVVHSREADVETAQVIRDLPPGVSGVLHCFTGGDALLDTALQAGWFVSFSGIVTFKRFDGAHRVRAVPRDRLLVETDAPYLAPAPHRGKRNEPAFVVRTIEAVARMRDEAPDELAAATTANARRFYGIDGRTETGR